MNILVIAPHPDDETIGCGGALCLHQQHGDHTVVVWMTSGELGLKHLPREKAWAIREKEARSAAKILGVARVHFLCRTDWTLSEAIEAAARALRPLLVSEKAQLIYVPRQAEWHPDHQAALALLRLALRGWRGALPEGMLPGESGFLVPERNMDALAQRLEFLVPHPEEWPEIGRRGRAFVEERYDIHQLNDRLVKLYRETKADFRNGNHRGES